MPFIALDTPDDNYEASSPVVVADNVSPVELNEIQAPIVLRPKPDRRQRNVPVTHDRRSHVHDRDIAQQMME